MNDHAIIERVLDRHRSEFGSRLLGVLVGGSRATTGGDPHSDLDVVVVVDRPCRKRWNFLINGIEVETFINPPFQMRRHFEEERHGGRGVMPHLCSYGHTPIGGPRYLRRQSADIVDQERWQFRYHAADFLRDLADVENSDHDRAASLIGLMLPRLIDQHCRINGRWLSKPKRVPNDLEVWDARAARLARQACNDQAQIRDRGAAARALADHDPCADWRSQADGIRNRKTRPPHAPDVRRSVRPELVGNDA